MTGLLHEKEFSRRSFVKGGGALIVGFGLAGSALARSASAATSPFASNAPYDPNQVDSWLAIGADNKASLKSGRVELGQGSSTGLLMLAAEELNMEMSQMVFVRNDTNVTPNTGETSASNSITLAGPAIRAAAATAHQTLLGLASTRLGVPVGALSVKAGVVSGGGKSVSYGELLGGKLFNVTMPASYNLPNVSQFGAAVGLPAGAAPAKPVDRYALIGTSPQRIEIPAMVTGTYTYVQNIRVPGMLHGRRVLPRGQYVYGFGAPLVSIDPSSISHLPHVRIVRKGDFVGVVAPKEWDAIQAAALLKVKWADPPPALPGSGSLFKGLRAQDSKGGSTQSVQVDTGNVDAALKSAAHVNAQSYGFPFNSLQALGPDCAVADVTPNGAVVFCDTSSAYESRFQISRLLGLPENVVRVIYYPNSSSFGGGQPNNLDIPQAAALMSRLAGAPVRLQHMRWDETGWGTYGPGVLVDIRGGIDSKGNIIAYDTAAFYPQYMSYDQINTTEQLVGTPLPDTVTDGWYYPAPNYNVPNERYILKSLPTINHWLKTQWNRSGMSPLMAFASEQMIDELAHAAKMDPVAFRLQNLTHTDRRDTLRPVIEAVTKAANWQPKVSASNLSTAETVTGRGFAAYYDNQWTNSVAATVADVEVNKKTGKVTAKHIYQAVSAGLIINPGLVENQIVGAMVYIASRTLVEQVAFTKTHVTSVDWITYPIMRFKESPKVTPIVVQRKDLQPRGVGEPVSMAATAALANAFFDATGVRIRTAPLTPARVRAALAANGQGTAGIA
jgi:CO/xanthine dehydrogenase Mo-binding subunit